MYADRISLTSNEILEKDFKVDTMGYNRPEVDKFLDEIIQDYEQFKVVFKELEEDKKSLIEDNIILKQEIRSLKAKLDILKENSNGEVTNADLLRRISNLEKIIFDN
ncbi:MAG: DivIVA domain-containing protein [Mycoplasmatota bacterium]